MYFLTRFKSALYLPILLIGLFLVGPTQAAAPTAKELLESTTNEVIAQLNQERHTFKEHPERAREILEEVLLPHIDIITSSKLVLGKHWRRATKKQKLDFIRQFRSLLLSFYSTGLANYMIENKLDENMFVFYPLRANEGDKRVVVRSELHAPNGKIVPLQYSMHQTKKGWKVYDVAVEGISVITTYRTSFAAEIKQKGLDGLITSLSDKNYQLQKIQFVSHKKQ